MSISLIGAKLFAGIGAIAIIGGAIGLGVSLNSSKDGGLELDNGVREEDLFRGDLGDEQKQALKNKTKPFTNKTQPTNVILARVDSVNADKDLTGKKLRCSIDTGKDVACDLLLIKENQTTNNVGVLFHSSLKEIKNTSTEAPIDSYVVVVLRGSSKTLEEFKNKQITVQDAGETVITVEFDQVLFKKVEEVEGKKVLLLTTLEKDVVSYLVYKEKVDDLFTTTTTTESIKCSFQNQKELLSDEAAWNVDETCKLIKIDFAENNKITSFDAFLKSSTPLTKEHLSTTPKMVYFKLEVDKNKFYNTDLNRHSTSKNIYITPQNSTEKVGFTLMQEFNGTKVIGPINWLLVKNKGDSGLGKSPISSSCNMINGTKKKEFFCDFYGSTYTEPLNKEGVYDISLAEQLRGTLSVLQKDKYFFLLLTSSVNIQDFPINSEIEFVFTDQRRCQSGNTCTKYKNKLEIIALLSGSLIPTYKPILISEIGDLTT